MNYEDYLEHRLAKHADSRQEYNRDIEAATLVKQVISDVQIFDGPCFVTNMQDKLEHVVLENTSVVTFFALVGVHRVNFSKKYDMLEEDSALTEMRRDNIPNFLIAKAENLWDEYVRNLNNVYEYEGCYYDSEDWEY